MTKSQATLSGKMSEPGVDVPKIGQALLDHLGSWDDAAAMRLFHDAAEGTALKDRLANTAPEILLAVLRFGAGVSHASDCDSITKWIADNPGRWSNVLTPDAREWSRAVIDIGSAQSEIARASAMQDRATAQRLYNEMMAEAGATMAIGSWMEQRTIYSTAAYISALIPGARRDFHLGYDVFLPALTPLFMPMDGTIVEVGIIDQRLDYGGYIVTSHDTGEKEFYALWGHLAHESPRRWTAGQTVSEGTEFALIGDFEENGWWLPHLHLQLSTVKFADFTKMPGVGEETCQMLWREMFPDPDNLILGR